MVERERRRTSAVVGRDSFLSYVMYTLDLIFKTLLRVGVLGRSGGGEEDICGSGGRLVQM